MSLSKRMSVFRRIMCLKWSCIFWVAVVIGHVSHIRGSAASALASPLKGRVTSDMDFVQHDDSLGTGVKYSGRCELINMQICNEMPYNETMLPNLLGHNTQEEAQFELSSYVALVKVRLKKKYIRMQTKTFVYVTLLIFSFFKTFQLNCSPSLSIFLCSLYAPWCSPYRVVSPFLSLSLAILYRHWNFKLDLEKTLTQKMNSLVLRPFSTFSPITLYERKKDNLAVNCFWYQ